MDTDLSDFDQAEMTEHMRGLIAGAVAEVDPRQMTITRRFTAAQRVQMALSMMALAEGVAAYRLRQRQPHLSLGESLYLIRSRRLVI